MSQPRHSVSVAAVITDNEGRVLVIQRRDNEAWQLPGGILELDETTEDGVRREVEEETGLTVEPVRLTGLYKNLKLGVVALVFRAELTGGTPGPTEESAAVDWWTTDQVAAEIDVDHQPGPSHTAATGRRCRSFTSTRSCSASWRTQQR